MRLLNITLAGILLVYAATGTFARFEADDYCQTVNVNESGVIGYSVDQYEHWQGRYSWTLVSLTLYRYLGIRAPAIVPAVLIVGMVGGWLYLLQALGTKHGLTLALALTLGFISGVPNIWQSVYWMNAALNYTLPLIAVLWFAAWLLRRVPLQAVLSSQDSVNSKALSNS